MALHIRIESRKPLGAVECAGNDQHVVAQGKARGWRRQTGVGIEQRDHDRHVGPADRNHDQHAHGQPDQDHEIKHGACVAAVEGVTTRYRKISTATTNRPMVDWF